MTEDTHGSKTGGTQALPNHGSVFLPKSSLISPLIVISLSLNFAFGDATIMLQVMPYLVFGGQ